MVSKNQIKRITGLHQKKNRQQQGAFIAEGAKVIAELLDSRLELEQLFETVPQFSQVDPGRRFLVTATEMGRMSALKTPNNCLAVFRIPEPRPFDGSGLVLALDEVRDPGNLGTILRICDWFGVREIVCSNGTADLYNPKVVQATMGSLSRVNVIYTDLAEFLPRAGLTRFGTFMDGNDLYAEPLPQSGIIIMGNEANGISEEVANLVDRRISIPRYGEMQQTESLNVATAAAVVLSEFRRKSR